MSQADKLNEEILKNSKFKLFISKDNENKNKKENISQSNHIKNEYSKTSEANKTNKDKNNSNLYENIDKEFSELRKSYPYLKADQEAEEYISHLRDVGEYNRWSLKLCQKWLFQFYKSKIINNIFR